MAVISGNCAGANNFSQCKYDLNGWNVASVNHKAYFPKTTQVVVDEKVVTLLFIDRYGLVYHASLKHTQYNWKNITRYFIPLSNS